MKYYYEVSLHEVGGDILEMINVPTKQKALALCRKIEKMHPNYDFRNDYYIQVQKVDNDEWSSDYMSWVDFWEYDPITKQLY